MPRKKKKDNTIRTMDDFERIIFPNQHKKRIEEEKRNDPLLFGKELASLFIKSLRQELNK